MSESRSIDVIKREKRYRNSLGDLGSLAKSIKDVGLLHPIVITSNNELVAGERRLEACKSLGWSEIPVRVVDLDNIAQGEYAENAERKDFLPSEIDAIRRALQPQEKAAAKERQTASLKRGSKSPFRKLSGTGQETRDKIGHFAGMSGRTVEKIAAICEAAEADPDLVPLVEQMDRTGKVDGAYKKLKKAKENQERSQTREETNRIDIKDRCEIRHCSMQELLADITADAIITDPPYPKEYIHLYGELAQRSTHIPLIAVMCGQSYLPQIIADMSRHLRYRWTLAYLTPGGQAVQQWAARVNTFWKPVLLFGEGDWIGDVIKSNVNDNDKQHHHWGQSESGMIDLVSRLVPPGALICDPFCGAGTTAIAAIDHGCRFIGCDEDEHSVATTRGRIGL
jgi:ParB-like chromosome segregation protein Spo0J